MIAASLPWLLLAAAPAAAPVPASAFELFFTGATQGHGTVRVAMSRPHPVRDRARGRMEGSTLVIEQVVEEAGRPPRRRSWRLVRSGTRVTGTVSDASGPVAGEVRGATLRLAYRMPEGSVEQWITLRPGGRTASARMVVRRFGLRVATVQSEIRKVE